MRRGMSYVLGGVMAGLIVEAAAEEPQGGAQPRAIEEIIVTAQKRAEKAQDVPIAITALDSKALEILGFADFSDLRDQVPSLTLAHYPQGGSALVMFMRGIGQVDSVQMARDPGVGIYLDDVYLARGQGLTTDLGDIERLEVLRGPQGTLYGRNTVGGAVKFVTSKPTGEFGFKQTLDFGNFGRFRTLTSVDLPELAGFSAKLSYLRSWHDGWVDNPGSGGDFGTKDEQGYRLALRWRPSEALTVDYAFDYGRNNGTSYYEQRQYPYPLFLFAFPLDAKRADVAWRPVDLPLRDDYKTGGHALTVEWSPTALTTFKSITAYRELKSDQLVDTAEAFNLPSATISKLDAHQFSQEFLLTGELPGADLKYTLGAYYFWEAGKQQEAGLANPFGLALAFPYVPPTMADFSPLILNNAQNRSLAGYGNFTWTLPVFGDRLTFDAGVRYSVDTRDATRVGLEDNHTSYNSLDPSFTLDFRWSDDVHTYAKYSRAYRAGGFNLRNSSLAPFAPERLTSVEIGLKSTWWQDRLLVNLAGFTQKYDAIQIDFLEAGSSPLRVITFNAGTEKAKGLEGDFEVIPLDGLRLTANFAYIDAQDVTGTDPFSGLPFMAARPYTPKWAYAFSGEYTFPPFSFGTLSALVGYVYSGKQLVGGPSGDFRPDYGLVNARIALAEIPLAGGRGSLAFWGNNLTDEEYQLYHAFGAAIFGEPLSYGVTLSFVY